MEGGIAEGGNVATAVAAAGRIGTGMLLDSGEGTYAQLFRLFGREGVADVLCDIGCVHISHMHADHHLGLLGVLHRRQSALASRGETRAPVVVVAPRPLDAWLQAYVPSIRRMLPCSPYPLLFDSITSYLYIVRHPSLCPPPLLYAPLTIYS